MSYFVCFIIIIIFFVYLFIFIGGCPSYDFSIMGPKTLLFLRVLGPSFCEGFGLRV